MATRTAKLHSGEDRSPIVDYTDLVVWEESEFGTRAHNGEGSSSTVVIRDPLGETGAPNNLPAGLTFKTLPAKSLFVIEVGSDILFRGRIGIKNYSRDGQHVERYRQVEAHLHDTNWDLDHIFVHQYERPAENDRQRAQGLIATYLSGSPRQTTSLNGSNFISSSNLVSLPAETYTRTSPLEILREISISANKQFFVTGDTITGGSLFYDGNDSTAYACTLSISDREDEVRANPSTVFPPWWNVGPASTEDGSELLSEVVLFYGTGESDYVIERDDTVATEYGFASGTFTDDTATASNASTRARSILVHRDEEDKTVNVTIGPLTDAQVVLIKHGQIINVKARVITYADDQSFPMRIGQCRYTTPVPGTWFAHLQLGRPWKMQAYSKGPVLTPKPAEPGTPATDTVLFDHDWEDGNETLPAWSGLGQSARIIAATTTELGSAAVTLAASAPYPPRVAADDPATFPVTPGTTYRVEWTSRYTGASTSDPRQLVWQWMSGSYGSFVDLSINTSNFNVSYAELREHAASFVAPASATAVQLQSGSGGSWELHSIRATQLGTGGTAGDGNPDLTGGEEDNGIYAPWPHRHTAMRTRAPTVDDDADDGYSVSTRWVNENTADEWILVDNTVGAAVWLQIAGAAVAGSSAFYGCRVWKSTTQLVSSGTATSIPFDNERFDDPDAPLHSLVSNTTRITVPTGQSGKYHIGGHIEWAGASGGYRMLLIRYNAVNYIARIHTRPLTTETVTQSIASMWELDEGDFVELYAFQSSGGNLNINQAADYTPEFWAYKIGGA